jgi:hypothetical protein
MSNHTAATGADPMTPPDLFAQMRAALVPRGRAPLVHLRMRDAAFFDHNFVTKAVNEAQARAGMVASGLDELSVLEQLALHLLCDSAGLTRPRHD